LHLKLPRWVLHDSNTASTNKICRRATGSCAHECDLVTIGRAVAGASKLPRPNSSDVANILSGGCFTCTYIFPRPATYIVASSRYPPGRPFPLKTPKELNGYACGIWSLPCAQQAHRRCVVCSNLEHKGKAGVTVTVTGFSLGCLILFLSLI